LDLSLREAYRIIKAARPEVLGPGSGESKMRRGYFAIGIFHGKTAANIGTLWRSAFQMGAAFIFTVGKRYHEQASDTVKTWRHLPMFEYVDLDDFNRHRPYDCVLVGIEMGGESLQSFTHPERTVYILGAEDHGLTPDAISTCNQIVSIPSVRIESYNVAVAGSIVMYDRICKDIKVK